MNLTAEQIAKLKALGVENRKKIEQMGKTFVEGDEHYEGHIFICHATSCSSGGADEIIKAFEDALQTFGLTERVRLVKTGCMGLCAAGPLARIELKGQKPFLYKELTPDLAQMIVGQHVKEQLRNPDKPLKLSNGFKEKNCLWIYRSLPSKSGLYWNGWDILIPKI